MIQIDFQNLPGDECECPKCEDSGMYSNEYGGVSYCDCEFGEKRYEFYNEVQ